MQALTNKSIPVNRRPMSFWERLYLINIIKGMFITFSHLFKKQPTVRYPEQKREFSPVFRDRKSTRLNSSHSQQSRMPSSA